MTEDGLFDLLDPVLDGLGARPEFGEEFRSPPLDVLRYYRRPVRLHWFPILGRASSIVAVARQPVDLAGTADGLKAFIGRLGMAVNGRFPPAAWRGGHGLAVGLTVIQLTPEPIGPSDETTLQAAFAGAPRRRAVPLGLIRVNLGQEAMAFTLSGGPEGLFPEPTAVADALTAHLRRFVPLIDFA